MNALIENLEKKYKPKDVIAAAEQMKKLIELKLKKKTEDLGDKIAELENACSSVLDKKQKVAVIVSAV